MKFIKVCLAIVSLWSFAQFAQAEVFLFGSEGNLVAAKIVDTSYGPTFKRNEHTVQARTTFACNLQLQVLENNLMNDDWVIISKTACRPQFDAHLEVYEEFPPSFWEAVNLPIDYCAVGICEVLLRDKNGVIFGKDTPLVQELLNKHRISEYLKERNMVLDKLNEQYDIEAFFEALSEFER